MDLKLTSNIQLIFENSPIHEIKAFYEDSKAEIDVKLFQDEDGIYKIDCGNHLDNNIGNISFPIGNFNIGNISTSENLTITINSNNMNICQINGNIVKEKIIVVLKQSECPNIITSGNSEAFLNDLNQETISLKTSGNSSVYITGKVNTFNALCSGNSFVNCEKLIMNYSHILCSGNSFCYLKDGNK